MKQLQIVMVDDEREILDIISGAVENILKQKGMTALLKTFTFPENALEWIAENRTDLIFLDIDMPKLDGIRLATILRDQEHAAEIIFVSNREDKVFSALKVHPFGFVRKNHFLKDISDTLASYLSQIEKEETDGKVVVHSEDGYLAEAPSNIMYFEGSGSYQMMYLNDREKPVRITSRMKKLEEELTEIGFIRVHKGYLLNFRFIDRIETGQCILTDKTQIPIARGKTQDVRARYLQLRRENGIMLF